MRALPFLPLVVLLVASSAGHVFAPASAATVHRASYDLEVEPGVTLRVVEAWTDASLARDEPLAALFVAPTLVTHAVWDAGIPDDPTYSGLYQAAQRGYFAFAFDHWGYGASSRPANGMDVTFERMLPQTAAVLEFARATSGAHRVDLVSGSLGNSLAFALGGDESPVSDHVGAIVMTSNVYANASLVLGLTVLGPAACDIQPPPPDGYTQTPPPLYAIILWNAEPEAQLWAYQTFPGSYAQGPTQEGCHLPVYQASHGRAPALVVYGDHDLLTDPSDVAQFVAEYGGDAQPLFLPGGGHAPYFESVRASFWDNAFAWFDEHRLP
ncbi:MAG TPA: alpha/beta fold hydrolase [Candidatus Thermoplasmatota archaeon]|nr:alpha/beta fold hydrolase [Candidatus Thermoplasmatota archaeon]